MQENMIRDDLSTKLIHLTKYGQNQNPSQIFQKIISDGKLKGSNGFIKGGYKCICFSETPISKLGLILSNPNQQGFKYAPFGMMFNKDFIYELGGRPVIYQSDEEYDKLDEIQKYRHVRFEPNNGIDFTWEREWRLKVNELYLDGSEVTLIVPTRNWIEYYKKVHIDEISYKYGMLGDIAAMGIEVLRWHFLILEDLGIKF